MKKLAVIILALLALCAFGALAEGRNALMGLDGPSGAIPFNSSFLLGDTFCAVSEDALYVCGPEDVELTAYPFPEEEDHPSGRFDVERRLFADGDAMYALRLYTDADSGEFTDATISRAGIENGALVFSDPRRVDLDELVYYNSDSGTLDLRSLTCAGGRLFLNCASFADGSPLGVVDLDTLRLTVSDAVSGVLSFAPYREGTLLVSLFDLSNDDFYLALGVYDPKRDDVETLCRFPFQEYSSLSGLTYDAENDVIYCVNEGEIHALDPQAGELGEAVNTMPLKPDGDCVPCILPDGTYAFAGTGAALRSLSGSSATGTQLFIRDSSWTNAIDAANLSFLKKNPDVNVVVSREITEGNAIIESLVNQDSSVDIYVMTTYGATYEAIYNRGYMLELDDCPNVAVLADAMYPALRESMTANGHIVTVPVSVSCSCLGVDTEVLSALGLTVDDVPDTWEGLVSFLEALQDIWPEDAGFVLMPYCPSDRLARNQLSLFLLMDYQTHFNASGTSVSFDAPILGDLLERIRRLDYQALGFEASDESEDYRVSDDQAALLNFQQTCTMGEWFTGFHPVLLSIDESSPHYLALRSTVAFVNPFTRNPETAKAFLDELAATLPQNVTYNFVPSLNEPVRSPEYAGERAKLEEKLESLHGLLETADPANKQAIKGDIEDAKDALAELDESGWMITQAQIDWFRAHDDDICSAKVEWLFNTEDGEALDLFFQYCQDQLGLKEMLSAVDRKIQMKAMEGG